MKKKKPRPFILGVNYWPRKKAMYWWANFDENEVKEEFEIIRSIGLNLVRIFLLWDDWQPKPNDVSSACLNNFEKVCNIANENKLQLDVTFFTGHMSGPNWVPEWMLQKHLPKPKSVRQVVSGEQIVDCGYLNPYVDRLVLDAEKLLLQKVVSNFYDHPGIGIWNLGNEPDFMAWPKDAENGRIWAKNMFNLIKEIDPNHSVTCGLHTENLFEDNGLRVSDIFNEVDMAVMHAYPMYVDWAISPLDPNFVPYTCALTSALCGKPVLMEEFGGCTVPDGKKSTTWEWIGYGRDYKIFMTSEDDFAYYIEQVLPKLVEVGALGALIWCFADYHPSLYHLPPCDQSHHERFFGLVGRDGSLKPHAEIIKKFAGTNPVVKKATKSLSLEMTSEDFYANPLKYALELYHNFV